MGDIWNDELYWCEKNGIDPWDFYADRNEEYFAWQIYYALDNDWGYVDYNRLNHVMNEAREYDYEVVLDGEFFTDEEHPHLSYYRGDVLVSPFLIPEV